MLVGFVFTVSGRPIDKFGQQAVSLAVLVLVGVTVRRRRRRPDA